MPDDADLDEWRDFTRGRRPGRVLLGVLIPAAVATVVGLVVLWPRGLDLDALPELGFVPDSELSNATVTELVPVGCDTALGFAPGPDCTRVRAELLDGPAAGSTVAFTPPQYEGAPTFAPGERIILTFVPELPMEQAFQYVDHVRRPTLLWLTALFVAAVIALAAWRGVLALGGLVVTFLTLTLFVVPAILDGRPPIAVALVGASTIMFATLYLSHGVSLKTSTALLGTLGALILTVGLGVVFVGGAHLTGLASEEAGLVQLELGAVDLRGLILAGIVIGTLGVLDDVTIAQAAAVAELRRANPELGRLDLYRRTMRIGRDHVAATVNTLVLAYAGAALPVFLLFAIAGNSLGTAVNGEVVALEIIRTLVGSIGLIAAVPLTSALAAWVLGPQPAGPRTTG